MKTLGWLVVAILMAGPAFADPERGFVEATGGIGGSSTALSTGWMSGGSGGAQVGVRVAPHLFVIGEAGTLRNLQPAGVDSAVSTSIASLATAQGLDVTGTSTLKASYGLGGLRVQGTSKHHVAPYAMAGLGVARQSPTTTLFYSAGTLPGTDPGVTTPDVGADVTPQLINAGVFTTPASTNSLLVTGSAGATIDIARHVTADAGYRLAHIGGDTPIRAQGVTFGIGLRF